MAMLACSEQPARHVLAVVVSIAEHPSPKWAADELIVSARTVDGATGSKIVLRGRLRCRIGDPVRARLRGVTLQLDAGACEG